MLQVPHLLYVLAPIYLIIGVVVVRRAFQSEVPRLLVPAFVPKSRRRAVHKNGRADCKSTPGLSLSKLAPAWKSAQIISKQ